MFSGIGKAFEDMFNFLIISLFICFPLALWKVIEIIIWIKNNINISIK